jgi:DtxR family transcriptional regulator, Mn-dependent transcriptional regulator
MQSRLASFVRFEAEKLAEFDKTNYNLCMNSKRRTSPSEEDYLEAVFDQIERDGSARVRDVASAVGVGKSSASLAIKSLIARGFVLHDSYGSISLTDSGRAIAGEVRKRHNVLCEFLVKRLGLSEEVADENACRMEHVISPDVISRFVKFVEFSEVCSRNGFKVTNGEFGCPHHSEGEQHV